MTFDPFEDPSFVAGYEQWLEDQAVGHYINDLEAEADWWEQTRGEN
jgi:hypothetical protein